MSTALALLNNNDIIGWCNTNPPSGSADLQLLRHAAYIAAMRNGVNPHEFRVYNTFTDASNGEWGALKWNANVLEIGAYNNGTGTLRAVKPLGTQWQFPTGSAAAPGVAFAGATGTGVYCVDTASGQIGFASNGSLIAIFNSANGFRVGGNPIAFGSAVNGAADASLYRLVAGVISVGTGGASGTTAWLQNPAGRARLTANATNATVTMSNLTDLSMTLIAGRKYTGWFTIIAKDSTAVDGLALDFNGGTATMTSFFAGFSGTPIGGTLGVKTTTVLGTALTITTVDTADEIYEVYISFVCNAGGTFIPRFAQVAHSTGTATVELGSALWLEDSPN